MKRLLLLFILFLTHEACHAYDFMEIVDSLYHLHLNREKICTYEFYKNQCDKYHQLRLARGVNGLYQDMMNSSDTICIMDVYPTISDSEGHTEVWSYGTSPLFFSYSGYGVGCREEDGVGVLTISFNEYEYGATSVAHIADTPLCIRDLCRIWDMDTLQKVWLQRGVVTATYHYMISRIILSKDDYSIDVEWVD